MAIPIEGIRPQVIDDELKTELRSGDRLRIAVTLR